MGMDETWWDGPIQPYFDGSLFSILELNLG